MPPTSTTVPDFFKVLKENENNKETVAQGKKFQHKSGDILFEVGDLALVRGEDNQDGYGIQLVRDPKGKHLIIAKTTYLPSDPPSTGIGMAIHALEVEAAKKPQA